MNETTAQVEVTWSWVRFAKIVATFAIAGPALGTLAAFGAPALLFEPEALFSRTAPFAFLIGYVFGFSYALGAGAVFAIVAMRFRWTRWRHAILAALVVDGVVWALMAETNNGFGGYLDILDQDDVPNPDFIFCVLMPSLVAAPMRAWLSRRWLSAESQSPARPSVEINAG